MKKIFVLLISMILCFSSVTFALSPQTLYEKIIVNREGAIINVSAKGEPNCFLAIELLYPGATFPTLNDSASIMNAFAYVDNLQTDSKGDLNFSYTAGSKIGEYILRLNGNITSLMYETLKNDIVIPPIETADSGEFFSMAWTSSGLTDDPNFQYAIGLSDYDINKRGYLQVAKEIKAKMNKIPVGRRMLMISPQFDAKISQSAEDWIWWDNGTEYIRRRIDEFFRVYREIGGNVDFIFGDFEGTMCNWQLDGNANVTRDVVSNPRYQTEIRPLLAERGYKFYPPNDEGIPELGNSIKDSVPKGYRNYLIWNAVMGMRAAQYVNTAIYYPIKKYFPDVKYSNYGMSDDNPWFKGTDEAHAVFLGGKAMKAGTHSSPELYSRPFLYAAPPTNTIIRYNHNYMNEITHQVNIARSILLSEPNAKIQPWIGNYTDCNTYVIRNTPYYQEFLLHLGMCNPEPFLYFGPVTDGNKDQLANQKKNEDAVSNTLKVLNEVAGYSDRHSIIDDLIDWEGGYILSGMYANGRNIWRFTPNVQDAYLKKDENGNFNEEYHQILNSTCVDSVTPTFSIEGRRITFPEGKILQTKADCGAICGFWIETPANVKPVITAEESYTITNPGLITRMELYNSRTGIRVKELSETPNDEITSVFEYKNNTKEQKEVTLIMVKYDENVVSQVSLEKRSMNPLSTGRLINSINPSQKAGTTFRYFIWGENMEPIAVPAIES